MTYLTSHQRLTCNQLSAQGFTIEKRSGTVIRMRRGNDYRLVQLDGGQKRAIGAKR